MNKRILSLVLALVMLTLCFVGCGDNAANNGDDTAVDTSNGDVVSGEKNENKVIVGLVIRNDTQRYICFSWGKVSSVKPEAPQAPKQAPKQEPKATPKVAEISAEELKARREWASAFKLTDGEHRGFTLIYLRKNNKQAYAELRANPPSEEIATVIQIIDEWVASTQVS
jgi:hypothetical protein